MGGGEEERAGDEWANIRRNGGASDHPFPLMASSDGGQNEIWMLVWGGALELGQPCGRGCCCRPCSSTGPTCKLSHGVHGETPGSGCSPGGRMPHAALASGREGDVTNRDAPPLCFVRNPQPFCRGSRGDYIRSGRAVRLSTVPDINVFFVLSLACVA